MSYKPIPIGVDNFEKIITEGYYYVDKTLFIKELFDKKGEVNLFTRPRRFGKSLNISMFQYFFDESKKDKAHIFEGLNIMSAGEQYLSEMNQYPVIKLTLKSAHQPNFDTSLKKLVNELSNEYERHDYLLDSSKVKSTKKETFKKILNKTAEQDEYSGSLKLLSECLEQHYNKKVIILIDEYDVPLETAYFNKYYDEMVMFIRSLFESALKTNDSLYFAILTGCLRISKESVFTGLNNLNIVSITSNAYGEYFGFTQSEVSNMLSYYNIENKADEVKEWYNGYLFGKTNVYNPWSMVKYLFDVIEGEMTYPGTHWANTSSNNIIRNLITIAKDDEKEEIEALIRGETITKPVHEDIVYKEIENGGDNLWNFLFFTGYLKKTGKRAEGKHVFLTLKIPNKEVEYIYERKIREWFEENIRTTDSVSLLKAILDKDIEIIENEINQKLLSVISYFDSKEAFYHGFLLGILSNIQGYVIKSNRETGTGRSDIFMKDKGIRKRAMVFELKIVKNEDDPEEKCNEALEQIENKRYAYDLYEEGYRNILKYGIAFRGKECMVKCSLDNV